MVYALDEGGQQSLWVTQVAIASPHQIVPPAEVDYRGMTFSRDVNFIYYVRNDKENPGGAFYQKAAHEKGITHRDLKPGPEPDFWIRPETMISFQGI